jgi:hypothetical protein
MEKVRKALGLRMEWHTVRLDCLRPNTLFRSSRFFCVACLTVVGLENSPVKATLGKIRMIYEYLCKYVSGLVRSAR